MGPLENSVLSICLWHLPPRLSTIVNHRCIPFIFWFNSQTLISFADHVSFSVQDCKDFVDMPMVVDPEIVLQAFHNLTDKSPETLRKFLSEYFLPPGSELLVCLLVQCFLRLSALGTDGLDTNACIHKEHLGSEVGQVWLVLKQLMGEAGQAIDPRRTQASAEILCTPHATSFRCSWR